MGCVDVSKTARGGGAGPQGLAMQRGGGLAGCLPYAPIDLFWSSAPVIMDFVEL